MEYLDDISKVQEHVELNATTPQHYIYMTAVHV